MKINAGLLGLTAAFSLGATLTFNTAAAAGLSTNQNLICAAVDVVACIDDTACLQGTAQTFDVPTFLFIDMKKKLVHTVGEKGGDANSPIKSMEVSKQSIILQGFEEHRGWTAAINRANGNMHLSSTGPELIFMIMGNCTTNQ